LEGGLGGRGGGKKGYVTKNHIYVVHTNQETKKREGNRKERGERSLSAQKRKLVQK